MMRQAWGEFMARWGIQSSQELRDIVTILQAVMRSQFQRLRPQWSQQPREEALEAIECMPTFRLSPSGIFVAHTSTPYHD